MSLNCSCPFPAAIGGITQITCPENLGQIRKIIFSRLNRATAFTPANIVTLATWTTAMGAVNDDHVTATPLLAAPAIAASEAITSGGNDNTTVGGFTEVNGYTNPQFTAQILSVPFGTIDTLNDIACETLNGSNIGVMFITGQSSPGQIVGKYDGTTNVDFFPIHSMTVSSIQNDGYATRDRIMLSFEFEGNLWQSGKTAYTPSDFNALTAIV